MHGITKRSDAHQTAVMELRRSNAAAPHANKARYTRKTKYGKWAE